MQTAQDRPRIIIIGAADTGRAPMAAAMLARHLQQRRVAALVESAGILGHDGDPASDDAQRSIEQMGLDIHTHVARSLTQEIIDTAKLLIAIDSGVLRVARGRFPKAADQICGLGELAGQERDIPDPFKMQIGAWLAYATEIDQLLERALPQMLARISGSEAQIAAPALTQTSVTQTPPAPAPAPKQPLASRPAPKQSPPAAIPIAAQRMLQVLDTILAMPHVISWEGARLQIASDLDALLRDLPPTDMAYGLAGLVRAALSMTPSTPSAAQASALREAISALTAPVQASALSAMSARLADWNS